MTILVTRPSYPDLAVLHHEQGVVVVHVALSEWGSVRETRVLEAPSSTIGDSVINAVKKWQFQKTAGTGTEQGARFSGKLTFYFVIRNGKASVLYPAEAGYVGLWSREVRK